MAQPLASPFSYFADANGNPLNGGKVYSYEAGTDTPKDTYTNSAGTVPATNPVILDSAGRATIWLSGYYKIVVKDSSDVTIMTTDNIAALGNTGDMNTSVYDPANVNEQLVGLTAVQTLTNKTLTSPILNNPTINGLNLSGLGNGLINGDFQIWQRNTTFAIASSTNTYTADRWCAFRSGATGMTVSRQTGPDGALFCARAQRDSGTSSTATIILSQSIQTIDSFRYRGKKVTLRFKARKGADFSAASSSMNIAVRTGTGTNQNIANPGYTGDAADIASAVTLTTSWQVFTTTSAAVVSAAITEIGITLNFVPVGTAGAADYFEVAEVELVEGSTSSADGAYLRSEYFQMLSKCLPFYEKSFIQATAPAQNAGTTGAITVLLPTGATGTFGQSIVMMPKRTAPTVTTYNTSATNANWRDTTNSADRTVTVGVIGENSFSISGASGAAASTNRIHWTAEAEI